MSKKKIAVHVQSEVQFFTLAPLIEKLKTMPYQLEVVIDSFNNDQSGYKEMASGVVKLLKDTAGITPKFLEEFPETVFDVYLTPYLDGKIKAKCYLKYEYGTLNIKPNLTYTPEVLSGYHGFLCQSTVTFNLLQVYGKTFPVDNLRFLGKKRRDVKRGKKQVLFAPTYNDNDNEAELIRIVENLKKKYCVVVKGHHGTEYLKKNVGKKRTLVELADQYYGSDVGLSDLILESDVCLFGNSSAIAEALYAGVPCAIISSDLDYFKLGDIHTTQYEFVRDDLIPYCKKSDGVEKIIEMALSEKYKKRQRKLAEEIFPKEYHTGVEGYLKVIDYFINDGVAQDYIKLHDYNIKERAQLKKELEKFCVEKAEFEDYKKRKLNRLVDKIYKVEGKIRHGKS